ncbi:XRN 5'-3' exonuclease N-terminus-domain-containing protein [Gymnopilus junonius]|uniref:5'-3' exoribonuclease n=1 Tax=Gymnopilus junonius TaxID=109634 RepID=A0A9P5TNU7_GYMJU|nr:XRN 5'-3' exonuclease N-terminus-domain-containing protein [Gymnopilus junonius]
MACSSIGVPALFRWLSKKYPKIIFPVVEEEETKIPGEDGETITVPLNITSPNPNGMEFDNLYLDMNGIVHPCTHPEGKPAPATEEEMMIEIFTYTERVVNMVRPRRLLFMAIDGVAPRAKMNQQRSRRFRSAQEAKEKEEARQESVLFNGQRNFGEEKNKVSWDSNAITPGTPFMDLLAMSLRYWVVQKMNTDPGWKNIQVIISDAGVPGEGEHKIMDYIRRQRSNPTHDPNTKHVIYGLDADLIMLALATHEPNFRVLREDVFANDTSPSACRICGQEGHYAAQCTGTKAEIQKKPAEKKPFIFLDVAILREYLEVELEVPNAPFPFKLEMAIDDWVLLIFFVGNDFLPHLPSLEIREGAIDTLLKIWKQELPRMGGYLTNHGELELSRAQIILEGLAKREDDIFRRRREAEERQDQNAKRRKIDQQARSDFVSGPSQTMALTAPPSAPTTVPSIHPSLPQRPTYDFAANADSIGRGAAPTPESIRNAPTAVQALAGSNRDVVANRRAIRMANMSAAEVLKAELSGLTPVKPSASSKSSASLVTPTPPPNTNPVSTQVTEDVIPGLGSNDAPSSDVAQPLVQVADEADADAEIDADTQILSGDAEDLDVPMPDSLAGTKRKFEEGPASDDVIDDVVTVEEEDDDAPPSLAMKVNADGTVEQEDTVKLWEPGYKERYYRQKFGIELTDTEFRKELTKKYVEGLSWVLHYYYQGTPSWQWYYPYHFAPFAADFEDIEKMDIKFNLGQPFKPFEQLMGVFPAASRKHIPEVFQRFMTDEDSPIIDFYPSTFQIDMNGKKMAWQGVALLPFIDETRLLKPWRWNIPTLRKMKSLYGKRKNEEPVTIDPTLSHGMAGSVLPNPDCIPGSTYYCPLSKQGLPDIKNDRSLSVLYFFPKQLTPHRSVILPGTKRPPRVLSGNDLEVTRNGGHNRGRGGWDRGGGSGGRGNGMDRSRNDPFHSRPNSYGQSYGTDRGGLGSRGGYAGGYGAGGRYGGRGGGQYQQGSYPSRAPYQSQPPLNTYGGSGVYGARSEYGGYGGDPSYHRSDYNSYGSHHNGTRNGYDGPPKQNAYNSYGSGGYGGYGGQGSASHSGYQPRGGASYTGHNSRGRGRTW